MRRAGAFGTVALMPGDPVVEERPWRPAAAFGHPVVARGSHSTGGEWRAVAPFTGLGPLLARQWPVLLLVGVVAVVAVSIVSKVVPVPVDVLLVLGAYLVGSRLPRRRSTRVVAVATAVVGGALVYAGVAKRGAPVAGLAVQSLVPLVAAWFVGDAAATRRRYQEGLAEQAEREQAAEAERARQEVREERVRIARELHDVVAHTLAVMTVQAGVGRRLMAKRPEEASSALESIEAIGRTAQEELRVVLGLLREEAVSTAELMPAPRLGDLKELAETARGSGLEVELRLSGAGERLSPSMELTVYRVVQEALTNVVKHAPGAQVTVDVAVMDHRVRARPSPVSRSEWGSVGA